MIEIFKALSQLKYRELKLSFVLTLSIIAILPLILFRTTEMLSINSIVLTDDDLYYGSKALILNILILPCLIMLMDHIKKTGQWRLGIPTALLAVFVTWSILLALFSPYKMVAMWGWPFRWQGAYTYFMYLILFSFVTVFIQKKDVDRLLSALLISSSLIVIYALIQYFGYQPLKALYPDLIGTAVTSTIGNRNFFGSYTCMIGLISVFMFFLESRRSQQWCYFLSTILLFSGVVISLTRGVWIGYSIAFVVGLVLLWRRLDHMKVKLPLVLVTFILTLAGLNLHGTDNPSSRIENAIFQVEQAQQGNVGQFGSGRFYIYQRVLVSILKYPLFGTGPDCLGYYLSLTQEQSLRYFGTDTNICIDKAHSEYLEYAATMGLPGLVLYVTFIGSILVPALKLRHHADSISVAIMVGVIGYLMQATFNIGVISVLPIFFNLLAFLLIGIKETSTSII